MNSPLDSMTEPERLTAFDTLAANALQAWELRSSALTRIACRENAVYAVDLADGGRVALRVHRYGYHSRASLHSELAWMRALANTGIATPTAVLTPSGDMMVEVTSGAVSAPHLCDILEWVEGRPLGSVDNLSPSANGGISDTYCKIGRIAARIHCHSTTWQAPADFVRPHWDYEGCLGKAALWGPWFDLKELDTGELRLLSAAVDVLDRTLRRMGKDRELYGLIHADLVPENVIKHEDQVVVIDFDDSGYGWYLWELATAVFWYLGTPDYVSALDGYSAGYRAVRPLPEEDLRLLPQFLLMRALVYMGWLQTRRSQRIARLMNGRVRELSRALAERVLAGNIDYRSIPINLSPLPEEA